MAERPIFVPLCDGPMLIGEIYLSIVWHSGFAPIQKKKNIKALHEVAAGMGYSPILEVSTKSDEAIGQRLSAFNLKVQTKEIGGIPLECAFQGSKVFERGGPYRDLYGAEPRAAKQDPRLQNSARLVGFMFEKSSFPLMPKTGFYDWLYLSAIFPHREWLSRLYCYAGFTDIEFNPSRSINCQARSLALFVTLMSRNLLEGAMKTPQDFLGVLTAFSYNPVNREDAAQPPLLRSGQ